MPEFLEKKLKAEYGAKSKVPYKVMNAIGAMKGPNETPKGARMQAQHEANAIKKGTVSRAVREGRMTHDAGQAAIDKINGPA